MFTFYIENHEPFGPLTKNCPKLDKNKSIVSMPVLLEYYTPYRCTPRLWLNDNAMFYKALTEKK